MKQSAKKKEGIARLIELASTNKWRMTAACTLSVLSSVCRIVPFFTIYKVLQTLIRCYASGTAFTFESVKGLVLITAVSAVLYGVFAYASAMLSHGAAFDILYELRMNRESLIQHCRKRRCHSDPFAHCADRAEHLQCENDAGDVHCDPIGNSVCGHQLSAGGAHRRGADRKPAADGGECD